MYTLRLCGCCHTDGSHWTFSSRPFIVTFSMVSFRCCHWYPIPPLLLPLTLPPPLFSLLASAFVSMATALLNSFSYVTILLVFFCAVLQILAAISSCLSFGDRCCHDGCNVVPEFVAFVGFGGLIGTLGFAFSHSSAAVLLVDFEVTN
jgi:hypothetical protein